MANLSTFELIDHLEEQLRSQEVFSSLDCAKFIESRMPDCDLRVPVGELEDFYTEAVRSIRHGAFVTRFFENFANKGLENLEFSKRKWVGVGDPAIKVTSHTANAITELAKILKLEDLVPAWWPKAYMTENSLGTSAYEAFWDWATVPLGFLQTHQLPILSKLLVEYESHLREGKIEAVRKLKAAQESIGSREQTPADQLLADNLASILSQKKPIAESSLPTPVANSAVETDTPSIPQVENTELRSELEFQLLLQKQLDAQVQLSMFAARRYLNKVQDALRRNIHFTLTIEDFTSLMRQRTCHFTGTPLTIEISGEDIQKRVIPDNYLSFDRLDSSKGYTRDNVVVLAHSVNIAKARMTEIEFRQLSAAAALMRTLSPEQRAAMQSLIAMNGIPMIHGIA